VRNLSTKKGKAKPIMSKEVQKYLNRPTFKLRSGSTMRLEVDGEWILQEAELKLGCGCVVRLKEGEWVLQEACLDDMDGIQNIEEADRDG